MHELVEQAVMFQRIVSRITNWVKWWIPLMNGYIREQALVNVASLRKKIRLIYVIKSQNSYRKNLESKQVRLTLF